MEKQLEAIKKEVLGAGASEAQKPEFKAAVGLSREWDARKAGREVAEDTLKKLGGKKPDFFLLFSTIHYEKYGGFKELLAGVWEVLPEGTPLIGGTVAGFINNEGCFTRGVTAMAASYPNMDVAIGVGKNTKRNPCKAAKECAGMIKKRLDRSAYTEKWFISLVSGGKVPELPLIGQKRVINSFFGLDLVLRFFDKLSSITQLGPGRDEEVLEQLSVSLIGFKGIGATSCDDLKLEKNNQFFMKCLLTDSVVSLAACSDRKFRVATANGLNPSGKKFNITKRTGGGYVLEEINNLPAVHGYLDLMKWPEEVLDERLYRKVFYYPFIQKGRGMLQSPRMLGLVYGKKFICAAKPIHGGEAEIYTSSGESMIESINKLFDKEGNKNIFLVSCGTKMETLGEKVYCIKKLLDERANAYLLIYAGGEFLKADDEQTAFMYQSDNALFT